MIKQSDFLEDLKNFPSPRPEWDDIWMDFAHTISRRSLDPRLRVGAVIISEDNTQVLAIGYNGDHKGGPNRVDSDSPGESGFLHAEINALIKCDYNSFKKKKLYLTDSPCKVCAKAIVNGNISEVIFDRDYRDSTGLDILREAGVRVTRFIFSNHE
jgi:dCMP deaminase